MMGRAMIAAYRCVLIAGVLPVRASSTAKWGLTGFNNNPHAWLDKQRDFRPHQPGASEQFRGISVFCRADALAVGFIVLRLLYLACYLADRATLRTLVWGLAYACIISLFVISA